MVKTLEIHLFYFYLCGVYPHAFAHPCGCSQMLENGLGCSENGITRSYELLPSAGCQTAVL